MIIWVIWIKIFSSAPSYSNTYAVGLKHCALTAGIKKYKSVTKKKRKKYDKIVLLAKLS